MAEESYNLAAAIMAACEGNGLTFATAESCTGGLVGGAVTAVPGISRFYLGGVVTYSNEAKMSLLGVSAATLESVGAVSAECAAQMAEGAARALGADCAVATTGIAGPGGATAGKPVGLVFIAAARRGMGTVVERHVFPGDRESVRRAAVGAALSALLAQAVKPAG